MLNILADVLLIATGKHPDRKHPSRHADADWSDRFISARMQGLDHQAHRFNPKRDLNW